MVAMDSNTRFELAEQQSAAPAVAGIVHGLVLVAPVWLVVASAALVIALR